MGWVKVSETWEEWKPEIGAVLTGKFGGFKNMTGRYGDFMMAVIRTLDGTRVSVPQRGAVELLETAGVGRGDLVKITFEDVRPVGENKTKHVFSLQVWQGE